MNTAAQQALLQFDSDEEEFNGAPSGMPAPSERSSSSTSLSSVGSARVLVVPDPIRTEPHTAPGLPPVDDAPVSPPIEVAASPAAVSSIDQHAPEPRTSVPLPSSPSAESIALLQAPAAPPSEAPKLDGKQAAFAALGLAQVEGPVQPLTSQQSHVYASFTVRDVLQYVRNAH